MVKKLANPDPPKGTLRPAPPPPPPLIRYIREDGRCGICPKCGSSLTRSGAKKCIQPLCDQ